MLLSHSGEIDSRKGFVVSTHLGENDEFAGNELGQKSSKQEKVNHKKHKIHKRTAQCAVHFARFVPFVVNLLC
jgi:hypothetical protein